MIIGLTGKRRSGKSTAAEILKDLDCSFVRLAFADALKQKIAEQYGMPVEDLYHTATKEKYRQLMQDYGTQAREIDPCVFVRPIFEFIDADPEKNYIIEDVRYSEELKELLARKGVLIKVFADQKVRTDRGAVVNKDLDNHSSEMEVADLGEDSVRHLSGLVIYNNKTMPELRMNLSYHLNLLLNQAPTVAG